MAPTTRDNPLLTGEIALAYLKELPDYYTRLAAMEAAGKPAQLIIAAPTNESAVLHRGPVMQPLGTARGGHENPARVGRWVAEPAK